jgi:hypothetical protein
MAVGRPELDGRPGLPLAVQRSLGEFAAAKSE